MGRLAMVGLWLLLIGVGICQGQVPLASPPEQAYAAFWATFRDHYAFFGLKGIDWDAADRTYRPQVTAQTTEAELVALFSTMVAPLHDGHITLARGEQVLYKGESTRHAFKQVFKPVQAEFWRVAYYYLQGQGFAPMQASGPAFKGTQLLYTTRTSTIGYVHLTRCFAELTGVVGTAAQEKQDQRLLLKLVRQALARLADCQVLLIDVRDNGGGHSGYELAGLFSSQRLLANYKATRLAGGYDHFTAPTPYYLTPAPGLRFTQPLVLLTSDQTASAAEDFTLALAQRARVMRVGTATKGMLSDMFEATLPGGLQLTLSNQRYTTPDGRELEDVGVPPTSPITNTLAAMHKQQDPVLAQALRIARQQRQ